MRSTAGKSNLPTLGLPVWVHTSILEGWHQEGLVLKELEHQECPHGGEPVVRVVRES